MYGGRGALYHIMSHITLQYIKLCDIILYWMRYYMYTRNIHMYISLSISLSLYLYIYIYNTMYNYIHIYIYICIHTYTHLYGGRGAPGGQQDERPDHAEGLGGGADFDIGYN